MALQHPSTPITEPIAASTDQQEVVGAAETNAPRQASDGTQISAQELSADPPGAVIEACIDLTEESEETEQTNAETKLTKKKKSIIQRGGGGKGVTKPESESGRKKKAQQGDGMEAGPSSEPSQARKRKAQSRKNPEPKKNVTKKAKKDNVLGKKKKVAAVSGIITDSMFGDLELPSAEVFIKKKSSFDSFTHSFIPNIFIN